MSEALATRLTGYRGQQGLYVTKAMAAAVQDPPGYSFWPVLLEEEFERTFPLQGQQRCTFERRAALQ